jgi:hypothetical protein
MLIMLIYNSLIFFKKKAQSVEYGFFICITCSKKIFNINCTEAI